jgi:hypothetical protein
LQPKVALGEIAETWRPRCGSSPVADQALARCVGNDGPTGTSIGVG